MGSYASVLPTRWSGFGKPSSDGRSSIDSTVAPRVGRVRLSKDATAVLGSARIGMLALRSGRMPIVNPAAFHFGAGSLWLTKARVPGKNVLARHHPPAPFFGGGGPKAGLIRGTLGEVHPLYGLGPDL